MTQFVPAASDSAAYSYHVPPSIADRNHHISPSWERSVTWIERLNLEVAVLNVLARSSYAERVSVSVHTAIVGSECQSMGCLGREK